MMGSINMGAASPFIEAFGTSKAAVSKVFSIIERKSAIDTKSSDGLKPTDIEGSIEFKNVSFEYPSRSNVNVSFLKIIYKFIKKKNFISRTEIPKF